MLRIIGLGSPQGDDQFGWRVIELLRQEGVPDLVELVVLDRPGTALLSMLQGVEAVLVVDAMDMGAAPGHLIELEASQLLQESTFTELSSHGFGVIDTLKLAQACEIELAPTQMHLVQLGHLDSFEPLSNPVQLAVQKLVKRIRLLFTQG
ncbi:hydrogenase maturation protease [Pontibacterium granulatum]|uniref:hydrogenase maturation protease n=1 Tax=Pontibacterium granulatum TaxID=2036029 RepID=UPI00249ACE67|nr:hydrogenase maturation protease [Pontibacterium granulatum]MDI3323069.1 hydrogenase maturation protease [Pontibacterium granulatum]